MGLFDRLRRGVENHEDTAAYFADLEEEPSDFETPLAKVLERVLTYRDEEIRDLRSKLYEAVERERKLLVEMGTIKYERNEAVQRIAKLMLILNKKQVALLAKTPFDFRKTTVSQFGDESRPITIPLPATMKTVKRTGSHGGSPLGNVVQADRKSFTERD